MRKVVTDRMSANGETFFLRGWPSQAPSKTLLVVHHGLGEHSGRYDTFAKNLEDLPLHLWSYDLRGHGETTGKRGVADGLAELAYDFEALLPTLVERAGAERLIVLGHSMGAASVGWYLTQHKPHPLLHAVALSAPPVRIGRTLAIRGKMAIARLLTRLAPQLTLSNEIDPEGISSDSAEVARYRADPLNHDRLSVRLGLSLLDDAPKIVERAGSLSLPLLLWHGVDDPIVDVEGSRALFSAWGGTDKALVELVGYRHESHHERPEKTARLFERLRAWLQPRLQGVA